MIYQKKIIIKHRIDLGYTPVEALRLARNRTSRSATEFPNVCSVRETTVSNL